MMVVEKRVKKDIKAAFSDSVLLARAGEIVTIFDERDGIAAVKNERGTSFYVATEDLEDL